MQTNIAWTGIEYHSIENCLINTNKHGTTIESSIVGLYEGKIYKVEYAIHTNSNWETTHVEIYVRHSNQEQEVVLISNGHDNWTMNGEKTDQFDGCTDVDIPVTPFTNTLPVNRLHLKDREQQQITVIYLDMLEWNIRPVKQLYRKISSSIYHYENIPNDFEAEIEVDENGFVVNYPQLFKRSAVMTSAYHL